MLKDSRPLKGYHVVIGVDQGYGNIKTANHCFWAGVTVYDKEPYFKGDIVHYNDKYYVIGEEHKPYLFNKDEDEEYYILTLAAIAKEMSAEEMDYALVHLAVGVPLNWFAEQRDRFRKYLLANKSVKFSMNGKRFHVDIDAVDIFPQGFAHIAPYIVKLTGNTLVCDIGNITINGMKLNNGKTTQRDCFTLKFGVRHCMIRIQDRLLQEYGTPIDEKQIEEFLKVKSADLGEKAVKIITDEASRYASDVMDLLREHDYNPDLMTLHIVGGGGTIMKNFGKYDPARVTINEDIMAAAKGYEYLAKSKLEKAGLF